MTARITLHLIRHAESHWNVEGRYQGQQDSGLTADGQRQAVAFAAAFAREVPAPDLVVTSDLPRVVDTCRPYAERVSAVAATDAELREVSVGQWSGRTFEELAALEPETVAAVAAGIDLPRGGGETFADTRVRVVRSLDRVLERLAAMGGDRTAVVFAHGGPIRVAAAHALGLPTPGHHPLGAPDNCSVTTIRVRDGRTELQRYNHEVTSTREADEREIA